MWSRQFEIALRESRLRKIAGRVLYYGIAAPLGWLLVVFAVLMLLALTLGPPIAVAWETWELACLGGTAVAEVRSVKVEHGNSGSRPVIRYAYQVDGVNYESDRYLPGFLGNGGSWTGGGAAAKNFAVGQKVLIHYHPRDPARASLEYGWFKWPIGGWLFAWSLIILAPYQRAKGSRAFSWIESLGTAAAFYGFGLVAFGPNAIHPGDLGWHILIFAALTLAAAAFHVCFGRGVFGQTQTSSN